MNRISRWRLWLGNLILGLPRSRRAVMRFKATGSTTPMRIPPIAAWTSAPEDELGVGVPAQKLLTRSDEAVVAVTGCIAYTTGFQLAIGIRKKHAPPPVQDPRKHYPEPPERTTEIGIRFSDGRETNMPDAHHRIGAYYAAFAAGEDPPLPTGPVITGASGGGGGRGWNWVYWVWPLPPDGPITVTCHWPAGGVPDGEADLDGAAIRRAGQTSQKLWGTAT